MLGREGLGRKPAGVLRRARLQCGGASRDVNCVLIRMER